MDQLDEIKTRMENLKITAHSRIESSAAIGLVSHLLSLLG